MVRDFKQEITATRESIQSRITESNEIKVIHMSANDELTSYKNAISDFFSYKNEAVRVKAMYSKLTELSYTRNRCIPYVNVTEAIKLYNDYLNGMVTFINRLIDEVNSSGNNVATMEKQLQTALQADQLFITSLFGGKNNASQEVVMTTAVDNIETMVDFNEILSKMLVVVNTECDNCAVYAQSYPVLIDACKLIVNSVGRFSCQVIKTCVETYDAIQNALSGNVQVQQPNTTFKVF